MFRWLLKPRFYSKCLSYVKSLKMRLEIIQKRRRATQKFMKSDIAKLLKTGFDYDAYIRAERILFEQKILSCYELIEKFVGIISDHLEDLTKNKDCPDECKEAVPSLIYAAARFSDLPELRDLRTLFNEKFGNSLEPYINREFVENLRRNPPTREMKIRLLYDIAQEFSIEWDDKTLRQRLHAQPSILYQERPKPGEEQTDGRDYIPPKGKEKDNMPVRRKGSSDESWIHQSSSDDEPITDMSSHDERKGSSSSSSSGSVSDEEVETQKPISYWLLPPPYLKQKGTSKGETISKKTTTDSEPTPRSVRGRGLKSAPNKESVHDDAASLHETGKHTRSNTTSNARATSFPNEPTSAVEKPNGPARTIPLETAVQGGSQRVRPIIPDWDDLVAYFAAQRKTKN